MRFAQREAITNGEVSGSVIVVIDPANPGEAEIGIVGHLKTLHAQQSAKTALLALGTLALGLLWRRLIEANTNEGAPLYDRQLLHHCSRSPRTCAEVEPSLFGGSCTKGCPKRTLQTAGNKGSFAEPF